MCTPPFKITSRILNLVAEISAWIERYAILLEQDTELRLRKANRIKTIHSSLAIEGNALSEGQVRDIINGKNVVAPLREIQEVKNAIATYDLFATLNPFDEKDLLRAHGMMMQALVDNPGCWRNSSVGVFGERGCVHLAPPAERVPALMSALFDWLKNADDHLLIRSCVFHYEFEFIHPFMDGNGRTGRLWQSLILSQLHPLFAHLPVENMVFSNQQAYYEAITASTSIGESTPFIEFMLAEILATLTTHQGEERTDIDANASALEREFGIIFGKQFGVKFGIKFGIKFGDNDMRVLLMLNSNPTFSSQKIADRLEITKRAVEKIIKRLRENNVLERIGSNKSGFWKINCISEKGGRIMKVDKTKWEKKTLGQVGRIVSGATPRTDNPLNWDGGVYNWVTPAELNGGKYYGSTKKKITDVALQSTKLSLMPIGSVLLSSRAPIGKVAITTEPMYCNQGFKNIICGKDLYNEYLYFYLTFNRDELNRRGNGVTFKEISKKIVESFPIVLPSLSEQQAIAAELDAVQAMIDGYKAQIADLDTLAQSIFLDTFGDPVSNSKRWEMKKLEDVSEIISGFAFPSRDFSDTNPVKAIKITNVGVGEFIFDNSSLPLRYKETDAFSAHSGDIALALTRTVISSGLKRAIVPKDYEGSLINQRVAVIRGTLINQSILYHYLGTEYVKCYIQKHAAALMQPNLSINDLRQLPILVPYFTLQQQFSQQVEAIDEQKKRIRLQLKDAETLMAERMQYYFS